MHGSTTPLCRRVSKMRVVAAVWGTVSTQAASTFAMQVCAPDIHRTFHALFAHNRSLGVMHETTIPCNRIGKIRVGDLGGDCVSLVCWAPSLPGGRHPTNWPHIKQPIKHGNRYRGTSQRTSLLIKRCLTREYEEVPSAGTKLRTYIHVAIRYAAQQAWRFVRHGVTYSIGVTVTPIACSGTHLTRKSQPRKQRESLTCTRSQCRCSCCHRDT